MPLVNFSGSSMEARYGGLPNGRPVKSYDACGPIRPWVLLKDVMESNRRDILSEFAKYVFSRKDIKPITPGGIVVRHQLHNLNPDFYSVLLNANRNPSELNNPYSGSKSTESNKTVMIVDSKIATLKNQHLIAGHTVKFEKYGSWEEAYTRKIDDSIKPTEIIENVMETFTNYVMLDRKNFKPIDLEDLLHEKVSLNEFSPVSVRVPEKLKFTPVYIITRTVETSDMDENFHMNQSNYLKWCLDAYAEFQNSKMENTEGKFDILSHYPIVKIDMQHVQEALVYQKCEIHIFNDSSKSFYFQFNKFGEGLDSKPLFISKIDF